MDSNHRPSGYEPDELPLLHAATVANAMVAHTRPLTLLICSRCIDLVSQGVIPPVPSALRRCTTRFGMERGGSSALKTHLKPISSGDMSPIYLSAMSFIYLCSSSHPCLHAVGSSALPRTVKFS